MSGGQVRQNGTKGAVFLRWFKLNHSNAGPECERNLGVATQVLYGHWELSELGGSVLSTEELVIRVAIPSTD